MEVTSKSYLCNFLDLEQQKSVFKDFFQTLMVISCLWKIEKI